MFGLCCCFLLLWTFYSFIPRTLSILQVLRHGAKDKYGLEIRSDGACRIEDITWLTKCSAQDLQTIVHNDEKTRFIVDQREEVIRCAQGHAINSVSDEHLIPIPLWAAERLACIHGTYTRHLRSISQHGLLGGGLRQSRQHVHFTPFLRDQVQRGDSWIRDDNEVLVQVHMAEAVRAGVKFFKSENNAILCRFVPPEFVDDVYWDFAGRCERRLPGRFAVYSPVPVVRSTAVKERWNGGGSA